MAHRNAGGKFHLLPRGAMLPMGLLWKAAADQIYYVWDKKRG